MIYSIRGLSSTLRYKDNNIRGLKDLNNKEFFEYILLEDISILLMFY